MGKPLIRAADLGDRGGRLEAEAPDRVSSRDLASFAGIGLEGAREMHR
jgi:hypothetical protein